VTVNQLVDEGLDYRLAHPSVTERGMRNYLESLSGYHSERSSLSETRNGCLFLLFPEWLWPRRQAIWHIGHQRNVDLALQRLYPENYPELKPKKKKKRKPKE
jgi:hypothetical protein